MESAVIFGAGNVGRGFLGEVFSRAGLEVVFVDVSTEVIDDINRVGGYPHLTVANGSEEYQHITPVRAISAFDRDAVIAAFKAAVVSGTCVGVRALPTVCTSIGKGLEARIAAGLPPIDLLIAENLHEAPDKVRSWLLEGTTSLDEALISQHLGLIATSIGRMIPAPREEIKALSPAAIEVEPYRYLPLDTRASRGYLPPAPEFIINPEVDFAYYSDRKLFVHNMGHAMCAYLGRIYGDEYIWQSIQRLDVRYMVRAAMVESAGALATQFGAPMGPLLDHIDDLLHRFANQALRDTVERVGRDPLRKLGFHDRFQGALRMCETVGSPMGYISLGLAAGLVQLTDEKNLSLPAALAEIGLAADERNLAIELVKQQFDLLTNGVDAFSQVNLLDQRYHISRIP